MPIRTVFAETVIYDQGVPAVVSRSQTAFLNQAHAWFLRIASVHKCMYACVCVCVCVCVPAPEAINN